MNIKKYITYLNERFPLQTHIPLIAVFSFSAISYSLSAVGKYDFLPLEYYLLAFFLTITTFFLLRISDEFKDHEDDVKYRSYLPVPRGLISLNELKWCALAVLLLQIIVVVSYPSFSIPYILALGYMGLMFYEFFIPEWLKRNQMAYVFSHMLIIPLVDFVASSAHWSMEGIKPPYPLIWFFLLSFFNGMVLEFGRKIKTPEMEEEGVVSYTKLYGIKGGVFLWLGVLSVTWLLSIIAAYMIGSPAVVYCLLLLFFLLAIVPGVKFLSKPTKKLAKRIEIFSGLWTLGMYLNIGTIPFLIRVLNG